MLSAVLGLPECRVTFSFLRRRSQVFPTGLSHNELKTIYVLFYWFYLFIYLLVYLFIYLFIYVFIFCFCLFFVEEQRWPKRVLVLLDPSILFGKLQKSEASVSKIKYRKTGKLEIGKPFAFSLFLGFGFGGQSDRKWSGRRKCKVLYEEDGTLEYDSILPEDNSALHPFLSYNTVKNVIWSLLEHPWFILF